MCRLTRIAPTPLQSIFRPIIDPILVTFGQICNFRDPNIVTFYLCSYLVLNEKHFTFHLQCKHSGTFANRKYEEPPYPKYQKVCDPMLVTLLKMRPHYGQSSRKNSTPSRGTSHQPLITKYSPHPPWAQNSNTANTKGVMSCEDKLEGLKLIAT